MCRVNVVDEDADMMDLNFRNEARAGVATDWCTPRGSVTELAGTKQIVYS